MQKRRQIAPEIMKEVMGHASYATTVDRYMTTTDEDIARICAAADGFERPPVKKTSRSGTKDVER